MTLKVTIGGNEVVAKDGVLTLIYKDPKITEDVKYAGALPITMVSSLTHLNNVKSLHEQTERFVRVVFPDYERVLDLEWTQKHEGTGFQHVVGRIDLTLRLQDFDTPMVWIHPENGLHPASQLNLADAILLLMKRGKPPPPPRVRMQRKPKVPL